MTTLDEIYRIRGQKILVVGASSGIGRRTAILLSELGADVLLAARNMEKLEETRSMMQPGNHSLFSVDFTDFDALTEKFQAFVATDGRKLNGAVYCAGRVCSIPIRSISLEQLEAMTRTNYYGFALLLKHLASKRYMADGGSIVGLASRSGIINDRSTSVYSASKAAMIAMADVASKELVTRRIRVNTICPEMTETPMTTAFFSGSTVEQRKKFYPLEPLETSDVANLIVFLLSGASSKITGQAFWISAGNDGSPIEGHIV